MKENNNPQEVKIGATSNFNKTTAAEDGAAFIQSMVDSNGWNQKLTRGQKRAAKKMAKELLKAGRITNEVYDAILAQLDKQ